MYNALNLGECGAGAKGIEKQLLYVCWVGSFNGKVALETPPPPKISVLTTH